MKKLYKAINFKPKSLDLIAKCEEILNRYAAQGYDMTLRQLYYQLVAGNVIPNKEESYSNLGDLVANTTNQREQRNDRSDSDYRLVA